jgi:PIN domain nuclease of toxin-antitoxin system
MRHAAAIEHVAVTHADPFDRLLLAQCEVETLRLLTADRHLSSLPVALPA